MKKLPLLKNLLSCLLIFAGTANLAAEIHTNTLIADNANECCNSIPPGIIIDHEFTFYIPNAFTPNGDGTNDLFGGIGIGIKKYELFIFDRWGNMIFQSNDLKNQWDGKVGSGKDAPQDVYVWKVYLTDLFEKKHSYMGTVTLVR